MQAGCVGDQQRCARRAIAEIVRLVLAETGNFFADKVPVVARRGGIGAELSNDRTSKIGRLHHRKTEPGGGHAWTEVSLSVRLHHALVAGEVQVPLGVFARGRLV